MLALDVRRSVTSGRLSKEEYVRKAPQNKYYMGRTQGAHDKKGRTEYNATHV